MHQQDMGGSQQEGRGDAGSQQCPGQSQHRCAFPSSLLAGPACSSTGSAQIPTLESTRTSRTWEDPSRRARGMLEGCRDLRLATSLSEKVPRATAARANRFHTTWACGQRLHSPCRAGTAPASPWLMAARAEASTSASRAELQLSRHQHLTASKAQEVDEKWTSWGPCMAGTSPDSPWLMAACMEASTRAPQAELQHDLHEHASYWHSSSITVWREIMMRRGLEGHAWLAGPQIPSAHGPNLGQQQSTSSRSITCICMGRLCHT